MSTKSMLHQARLNEWASRFADQKSSGLTVTEWCKQANLSEHKYFYWKRLLKEEAIEQVLPDIVPLAITDAKLHAIVDYELIPMLKEYWFDEPLKVTEWSDNLRRAIR